MLTQEQIIKIAERHGMSYGVKILPESPLFNNKQCLADFANEIYTAGMAAGEAKERERAAKVCDELGSVFMHRWISNLTP